MVSQTRIDPGQCWYHVVNRGVRKLLIFASEQDRSVFLSYLSQLESKFGVEAHVYCLMSNHYHLLVYSRDGELSASMQWLGSRYARYFNCEYEYSGAVFQARFFSEAILSDEALLQVSAYIHRNPSGIDSKQPLHSYRWSSYGSFVGARERPPWLHIDLILRLTDGSATYRELVELLPAGSDPITSADSPHAEDDPAILLHDLDRAVALTVGGEPGDFLRTHPGEANLGRDIGLVLAAANPVISLERIGSHYGMPSSVAARRAIQRAERRIAGDPQSSLIVERLKAA